MKIKQLIPISNEYAVLATDDYDYKHICYDRKLDGKTAPGGKAGLRK